MAEYTVAQEWGVLRELTRESIIVFMGTLIWTSDESKLMRVPFSLTYDTQS